MRLFPGKLGQDDDRPLHWMIPNIMTLLGLISGGTAIRFAFEGNWRAAIIAILIAAIFDGLDGRLARALKVSSRFGAELDSLSDFLSFALAPAMILYFWSLKDAGSFGWAFVLLFAACGAIRLARFNVGQSTQEQAQKPKWMKNYFTGVPTPAGAGIVLLPLIFYLQTNIETVSSPIVTAAFLLVTSILLISRIPTFSAKMIKVPRPLVFVFLIAVILYMLLMISAPWLVLAVSGLIYILSIPLSYLFYRRKMAAERMEEEEGFMLTLPDEPGAQKPEEED